jgi:putative peptide zinc metalloprotease protein
MLMQSASTSSTTLTQVPLISRLQARFRALRTARRPPPEVVLRPRLVAGVHLRGRMTESAFADQPWLVERNGRFLQVTEMLYRVAELADGTRSIEDIARALSTTLGAQVSTEYVQRLLETKLAPIGIVAADSMPHAPTPASPATPATSRSPLALHMRMALVSPRLLDPATRVLQYLYVPPVLALVLFVTVQAQYWLVFVHGTSAAITQAVNKPGLVPLAFALLIASAAFHELGHAAALRYGGGRVRSMGVGLYLMYPAFYTDVTDNYRLRRWARVRTDLGGFYFNLVFSLALMGVYHLTGEEFLLLVALLIDLDIAHQCLPVVRLDGYWALADLTGIPDFFSLMGAYLRSVIPIRRWTGRKLPRLKWWAKVVFGLYIGVALPAIAFLLFAVLNATPHVVTTACGAAQRQLADVAAAQSNGDGLGVASAEVQLLLVLVPALGLCLMLVSLARTLACGLWRWGRPTPARRLVASVVATSVAAFVVLLWVPDLRPTANARVLDWAPAGTPEATATPTEVAPAIAPTAVLPPPELATPTAAIPTAASPTPAVATPEPPTPTATEVPSALPTPTKEVTEAPRPQATEPPRTRATEPAPPAATPVRTPAARATPRPPAATAASTAGSPSQAASTSAPGQPTPYRARLTASPTRP